MTKERHRWPRSDRSMTASWSSRSRRRRRPPGGILLPDTAKEKPQRGKVHRGRPGQAARHGGNAPRSASWKGDEVLYGKYAGTDVEVDGEEIKILRESDILAKIVK